MGALQSSPAQLAVLRVPSSTHSRHLVTSRRVRTTSVTGCVAVSVSPRVVRPHCSSVQASLGPSRASAGSFTLFTHWLSQSLYSSGSSVQTSSSTTSIQSPQLSEVAASWRSKKKSTLDPEGRDTSPGTICDLSSVRRDVRATKIDTTAILHGIGFSSTSSQSSRTTESPPVRGRPGGHDGNGCRSLSAVLFFPKSGSCAGCVLIQFLILLHVLLSAFSPALLAAAGLVSGSFAGSGLGRLPQPMFLFQGFNQFVHGEFRGFFRRLSVRELFHRATVFSSDGREASCWQLARLPRPRLLRSPSASSVFRTCHRIRVILILSLSLLDSPVPRDWLVFRSSETPRQLDKPSNTSSALRRTCQNFLDSLMSHQTLTAWHNQFFLIWKSPVSFLA